MKTHQIILFIGHLWPEPTSSAAGYRTLALLKSIVNDTLSDDTRWQLHFASAAEKTEFCANLDQLMIISHSIKLNDHSFDNFITDLKPDIIFYDRFITEEQFAPRVHEYCPDAINILDTQDLHFLRRARHKSLKDGKAIDLYTDNSIREIAAILRCDLSLIISSYEMQLLIEQFNISPEILHYCPFMLSLDKAEDKKKRKHLSFDQREHFVMIGNFLHPPNWDAVLWCYQAIWPLIRQQLPQAQIHIYGAYPSEKVWQLHQPDKGFIIKGRADNATDTLKRYRVNLAPLRFGAGIKGKIADGFIVGTPCVTTKIGQEGMADNLPWGGLVADDIPDKQDYEQKLAQYSLDLYQDASLWQKCSTNGKLIISSQFNEKLHAEAFMKRIHQLIMTISGHRKNNFYGQILRHNLYRSQYFMSKWIEEKNKN